MEFWYAKKGSSGGWLSVRISENDPGVTDSVPSWRTTSDTNGDWKRGMVDISSEYPYRVGLNIIQVDVILLSHKH